MQRMHVHRTHRLELGEVPVRYAKSCPRWVTRLVPAVFLQSVWAALSVVGLLVRVACPDSTLLTAPGVAVARPPDLRIRCKGCWQATYSGNLRARESEAEA